MKGFVGGIPIALLAVAAQAKFVEHQEHGFPPSQYGGTAIGGPSGDDSDGVFTSPYSADIKINTQVNEWSKDDHSSHVKDEDVYPAPHHAPAVSGPPVIEGPQVPGMGPFGKRHAPGGTAMGGPSGNDEGQSFDMPVTGIFNTEVNDYNQDDHSIDVQNKHIHEAPVVVHPPPQFKGPARANFHGPPGPPSGAFDTPPEVFEKRVGSEEGGTAIGGPGSGSHHSHGPEGFPRPNGGTAIGGPSGHDGGISFSKPVTGHFHTDVNEFNKDDHSIDLEHKDEYPQFPNFGAPFKRGWGHSEGGWEPSQGGTAMGGPSGDDGGQSFSAPITIETNTDVNEHSEDNHGIHVNHEDIHTAPHVVPGYPGPGPVIFDAPAQGPPHGPPQGPPQGPPHGPPHGPHPDVFAPHTNIYAPETYAPEEDFDLNSIKQLNSGPSAGAVGPFGRRAFSPKPEASSGGTAIGGPSGDDDGVGPSPFSPKHKASGGGGGTAIGGPSGDDDGLGFSDPTTVDVTTNVNEHNEDNHGIHIKHKDVHPAPHVVPGYPRFGGPGPVIFDAPAHGPPQGPPHGPPHGPPQGPPHGPHPDVFAPHTNVYAPQTYAPEEDLDLTSIKQINSGPSAGAVGPFGRRAFSPPHGPPQGPPHGPHPDVFAPHTNIYAPQTYAPEEDFDLTSIEQINSGPSAGAVGPFGRRAFSPSREAGGGGGGTAIGGPSGDDDGVGFSDPTNVDVNTDVNEHNEDNHSITADFTHVHPPKNDPWDFDEATPYEYEDSAAPAEFPVSEDPAPPAPAPPVHSYGDSPPAEVPESHPSPPSPPAEDHSEAPPSGPPSPPSFTPGEESTPPREQQEHDSQCSAQVHEVVRTVTKTQYKTDVATRLVYQSAPASETSTVTETQYKTDVATRLVYQSAPAWETSTVTKTQYKTDVATRLVYQSAPASETSAIPMAYTPQQSAKVDPKIMYYAASASAPASSEVRNYGYNYASKRPISQSAPYSMIPVHVPMATPSSSGAYSMATPSGTHGLNMPTDISAEQKASPSSSASASASHGTMFMGAAPRVSGGLVSAVAAVIGVLAFIL